jgi:hypothetical protein
MIIQKYQLQIIVKNADRPFRLWVIEMQACFVEESLSRSAVWV